MNATSFDPQLTLEQLADTTGLSVDDVSDGLYELRGMVEVNYGHAFPRDELFAAFDMHWMGWSPPDDALRLAADLINDGGFPHAPESIAARYGWEPRRLNPAIAYLANREVVRALKGLGSAPFVAVDLHVTDATRRFVRSRS